jgi:hypothetical protein
LEGFSFPPGLVDQVVVVVVSGRLQGEFKRMNEWKIGIGRCQEVKQKNAISAKMERL